jgi:hypothetical protein
VDEVEERSGAIGTRTRYLPARGVAPQPPTPPPPRDNVASQHDDKNRDNAVATVTGCGLDDRGVGI